jgi:hypothetical protein
LLPGQTASDAMAPLTAASSIRLCFALDMSPSAWKRVANRFTSHAKPVLQQLKDNPTQAAVNDFLRSRGFA